MTERARRRFIADGINPRARTCDEAYEQTNVEPTGGTLLVETLVAADDPNGPQMKEIRVDGNRAVASDSNRGRTRLHKIDGRWLIDSH